MGTAERPPAPWPPPLPPPVEHRYATPTGECCLRALRVDGTVEGSGDCVSCGTCLLVAERAWG